MVIASPTVFGGLLFGALAGIIAVEVTEVSSTTVPGHVVEIVHGRIRERPCKIYTYATCTTSYTRAIPQQKHEQHLVIISNNNNML